MAVNPDATTITPEGLGLVLLIVALFYTPPSAMVVIARSAIRIRQGIFGMDDGLMLVGWILFICVVGVVSKGTYVGIGAPDERLNHNMQRDGRMYIWLFQTFYCCSLIFIKGSICVTFLRIAIEKTHRIIVWMTLVASVISTLIVIIGLLTMCRPISANWDKNAGQCSPPIVITSLSYLVSAAAVLTDWVCAILPGFMLYKTQMKRATKISINVILGLGVLASIATIVRLPYIAFYAHPENYLHNVGNIVLWSVFESGTGIIAGSLPSLRQLVKNWITFDTTNANSPPQITPYTDTRRASMRTNTRALAGRQHLHNSVISSITADRDWEQLDDNSSRDKIFVKVDVEMRSLERPATAARSDKSLVGESRLPA
ncbi:hypothetical protein CEP54_002706 [Fusarium duplospermum]|uniref:Rhodopsin domain-containing protein n=1 Tax=Fusarium duplospermum TaxID=1325734 RepID=A0A428QTS0_9HYPO|nr:hypothetical protein CEP54_002706 [Fusarium duplospermum]